MQKCSAVCIYGISVKTKINVCVCVYENTEMDTQGTGTSGYLEGKNLGGWETR